MVGASQPWRRIFELAVSKARACTPFAFTGARPMPADRVRYLVHPAPAWTFVVVALAAGIATLAVLAIGANVRRRRGERHRP